MVYTKAAREYLETIVGSENVITDISELLRYGNPDCIVKVSSIDHIQQVLEVANEQDIGIIPKGNFDTKKITLLKERIEQSNIPYKVDVVNFNEVGDAFKQEALKEYITWKD